MYVFTLKDDLQIFFISSWFWKLILREKKHSWLGKRKREGSRDGLSEDQKPKKT
jgi:hypothetical protein